MTAAELTRKINSLSTLRARARRAGDEARDAELTAEIGRLRVQRTEAKRAARRETNDGPQGLKDLLRF